MHLKAELRTAALAARRALPPEVLAAKNAAIAERVRALDVFRNAPCVLSYVSSKDNETDTRAIIENVWREGRTVLVPVAEPKGLMTWNALSGWQELAEGRFGILEPRREYRRPVTPPAGAVCLVPGIAFSETGHRIGYGGGYYDRFLARFEGLAIGLAFQEQIVPPWHLDPHDVPVRLLITDQSCYRIGVPCSTT